MKIFSLFFVMIAFSMNLYSEEILWDAPTRISNLGVDSTDAHIGMDASGNVVAVFIQDARLAAATKLAGGGWTTSEFLSAAGAADPKLVVDQNGNATVMWIQGSGGLRSDRLPFGGTWEGTTNLDTNISSFDLNVSPAGDVVAVWEEGGIILSKTRTFGGSWPGGAPDTLSSTAGADNPKVAIGADGTVVTIWHNIVSTLDTIFASVATSIGGVWSLEEVISSSEPSTNPSIAVDSNGNALAGWYTFTENVPTVFSDVFANVATRPSGGSWSTPITLLSDPVEPGLYDPNQLEILVGFDVNRNAVAVWRTSPDGGDRFEIVTSVKQTTDLNWSLPELLEVSRYGLDIDMVTPPSRFAVLAFMRQLGTSINIQAASTNLSSLFKNVWTFTDRLSVVLDENAFPSIAATVTADNILATVVWTAFNGNITTIRAADGSAVLLKPPENLGVVQSVNDFNVFTEIVNTLTWTKSPSSPIAGYVIYRNGFFVRQVGPSVTSFEDNNRISGENVTYEVSAIDNTGAESERVSIVAP